jgi:hypothetical protein
MLTVLRPSVVDILYLAFDFEVLRAFSTCHQNAA